MTRKWILCPICSGKSTTNPAGGNDCEQCDGYHYICRRCAGVPCVCPVAVVGNDDLGGG